jgi:RIO-like serine/threonine protein kinase
LPASDSVKTDGSLNLLIDPLNSLIDPLNSLNPLIDSLTDVEKAFFSTLLTGFAKHEWIDNAMAKECAAVSPATIRRRMKRLVDVGILETRGTTRNRQYRLRSTKETI